MARRRMRGETVSRPWRSTSTSAGVPGHTQRARVVGNDPRYPLSPQVPGDDRVVLDPCMDRNTDGAGRTDERAVGDVETPIPAGKEERVVGDGGREPPHQR